MLPGMSGDSGTSAAPNKFSPPGGGCAKLELCFNVHTEEDICSITVVAAPGSCKMAGSLTSRMTADRCESA